MKIKFKNKMKQQNIVNKKQDKIKTFLVKT